MTAFTINSNNYCSEGYVTLQWNHSANPNHYSYRVYGRNIGDADWHYLYQITEVLGSYTWRDYLAASNVPQEWAVVQVTTSGSNQIEESKEPQQHTPLCDAYWLIYPSNYDNNLRLEHVTNDTFSEEYEEEMMKLIGRGRKSDRGTRFGIQGTLTADIRDMGSLTAYQQQAMLRTLIEQNAVLYLRNPFGDVWKIVLGNVDFSRIPGVGASPWVTVTIPYMEVA